MKKTFFFAVILLLLTTMGLHAQFVKSIALKPGLVIANQCWNYKGMDDDSDSKPILGFHVAANAEFLQHKIFSILAEVGFTPKGYKEEVDMTTAGMPEGTGGTKTYKTTHNYLYLAPMFKARMAFGKFVPYLFVGPRIDFQLSYKSDFDIPDMENEFNKTIIGMNYGLGLEYLLGNIGIGLVFHQQLDFSRVYHKESSTDNVGLDIKNNAYVIDFAVKYYFGKK